MKNFVQFLLFCLFAVSIGQANGATPIPSFGPQIKQTSKKAICPSGYTAEASFGTRCFPSEVVPCPAGTTFVKGEKFCRSNNPVQCQAGFTLQDGLCKQAAEEKCPAGLTLTNGICAGDRTARCQPGETMSGDTCSISATCASGNLNGGKCTVDTICAVGFTLTAAGQCGVTPTCPAGTTFSNGMCVAKPTCPTGTTLSGEQCVKVGSCPADASLSNGVCVSKISPRCRTTDQVLANGICTHKIQTLCPIGAEPDKQSPANKCTAPSRLVCPPESKINAKQCEATATCPAGLSLDTYTNGVTKPSCTVALKCPPVSGWNQVFIDGNKQKCSVMPKCYNSAGQLEESSSCQL